MTLADKFKKICLSLGKNNNPAYAVMAIATVKGICRPTFTMMDKTEDPETKKYTALREGLTEAIAIPAYWTTATLAGKMSHLFKDKKQSSMAQKNLLFIGVCTAALLVIPATCSIAIKPFMKLIQKDKKKDTVEPQKFDTGSVNNVQTKNDTVKSYMAPLAQDDKRPHLASFNTLSRVQPSMKVGGV